MHDPLLITQLWPAIKKAPEVWIKRQLEHGSCTMKFNVYSWKDPVIQLSLQHSAMNRRTVVKYASMSEAAYEEVVYDQDRLFLVG
jgi:hypothetical protein